METFKAGTQYGDWEGTAKADGHHGSDFSEYLRQKGLINEDEFLIAISFYSGEGGFTSVRAFVLDKGDEYESVKLALSASDDAIKVREVTLELTTPEFLSLFKRFSVVLTWHGLGPEGREYYTD